MKRYLLEYLKNNLDREVVVLGGPRHVGKTQMALDIIQANDKNSKNYLCWEDDDGSGITGLSTGATQLNELSDASYDGSSLFIGYLAGDSDDGTGNKNVGSGWGALRDSTTATNNTATGYSSLHNNTIGNHNSAFGSDALYSNTIGAANTANGSLSLNSNTEGAANTSSGFFSMFSNTTGSYNSAIGNNALKELSAN